MQPPNGMLTLRRSDSSSVSWLATVRLSSRGRTVRERCRGVQPAAEDGRRASAPATDSADRAVEQGCGAVVAVGDVDGVAGLVRSDPLGGLSGTQQPGTRRVAA